MCTWNLWPCGVFLFCSHMAEEEKKNQHISRQEQGACGTICWLFTKWGMVRQLSGWQNAYSCGRTVVNASAWLFFGLPHSCSANIVALEEDFEISISDSLWCWSWVRMVKEVEEQMFISSFIIVQCTVSHNACCCKLNLLFDILRCVLWNDGRILPLQSPALGEELLNQTLCPETLATTKKKRRTHSRMKICSMRSVVLYWHTRHDSHCRQQYYMQVIYCSDVCQSLVQDCICELRIHKNCGSWIVLFVRVPR